MTFFWAVVLGAAVVHAFKGGYIVFRKRKMQKEMYHGNALKQQVTQQ